MLDRRIVDIMSLTFPLRPSGQGEGDPKTAPEQHAPGRHAGSATWRTGLGLNARHGRNAPVG
jgi:hypothetical protein